MHILYFHGYLSGTGNNGLFKLWLVLRFELRFKLGQWKGANLSYFSPYDVHVLNEDCVLRNVIVTWYSKFNNTTGLGYRIEIRDFLVNLQDDHPCETERLTRFVDVDFLDRFQPWVKVRNLEGVRFLKFRRVSGEDGVYEWLNLISNLQPLSNMMADAAAFFDIFRLRAWGCKEEKALDLNERGIRREAFVICERWVHSLISTAR